MSDFNSSLPVRTESAGDVDVFISDSTTPSQKLKVEADGSINVNATISASEVTITDGADDLNINADGSINVVATATDLDIRDLAFSTDKVDVSGSEVSLDSATLSALENITVSATDLDIRDLAFATDKVDVSGSSVTVSATDLDIRDIVAASDSIAAHLFDEAGVAFSSSNPLPVEFFENKTESFDYNKASAIAASASSTHTYAAASGFKVYNVHCSASGKMKVELKINSVVVGVKFNSTANPNIEFKFDLGLNASGVNIEIVRTNLDNQAQDLYSTVVGAV